MRWDAGFKPPTRRVQDPTRRVDGLNPASHLTSARRVCPLTHRVQGQNAKCFKEINKRIRTRNQVLEISPTYFRLRPRSLLLIPETARGNAPTSRPPAPKSIPSLYGAAIAPSRAPPSCSSNSSTFSRGLPPVAQCSSGCHQPECPPKAPL